jgi:hypothetical protein
LLPGRTLQPRQRILKANEAGTGSAVVLLPGPDFTPGEHLEVAGAIDIGGVPGQSRPTIRGAKNVEALVVRNGAHLHDANVIGANQLGSGFTTLQVHDATAERVFVEGTYGAACWLRGGSMTDSVCLAREAGGLVGGDYVTSSTDNVLRNVDAIGSEAGIVVATPNEAGDENRVEAVNTIALSTGDPASDPDLIAGTSNGGTATVVLRNSDYDSMLALDPGDSVTSPGTAGNVKAPPQLVDLATGDLHQLATSPTVDAGLTEAVNGDLDLDRNPRALSAHPTCESAAGPTDIGAYEYVVPLPTCAPPAESGPGSGDDHKGPPSPPPAAPETALKKAKIDRSAGTATLTFLGTGTVSGFRCELVRPVPKGAKKAKGKKATKPRFAACGSPKTYKHLAPGRYTFKVEATGAGGIDATPAARGFTIGGGAS